MVDDLGFNACIDYKAEGKFNSREGIAEGLNTFPETPNMLLEGKNFGKLVLRIASE